MNSLKFLLRQLETQLHGLKAVAELAPSDYAKGCIDTYEAIIKALRNVVEDTERAQGDKGESL